MVTDKNRFIISSRCHLWSSSAAHGADSDVQHRQGSIDSVNKQDVDMNNDDKENDDPIKEDSNFTVSRNRETQDDDRDRQRQMLSSVATHRSKPQRAEVLKCWNDVNGGELSAGEVQKARQLEVERAHKVKVVERVPCTLVKHRIGKELIKVRWRDTLKAAGYTVRGWWRRSFVAGPKSMASRISRRHHF